MIRARWDRVPDELFWTEKPETELHEDVPELRAKSLHTFKCGKKRSFYIAYRALKTLLPEDQHIADSHHGGTVESVPYTTPQTEDLRTWNTVQGIPDRYRPPTQY